MMMTLPRRSHLQRLPKSVHRSPRKPFSKILSTLAELKSTINLQWLLGHSEVLGNESADVRAKEAATNNLNLERPPISLEAASTVIKQVFLGAAG